VDHHRHLRQGIPEVIYAEGKKPEEVAAIARALYKRSKRLFITRASESVYKKLDIRGAVFHAPSRTISAGEQKTKRGSVLVISAGTSDIPVAQEAARTASYLGSRVSTINVVGGLTDRPILAVPTSVGYGTSLGGLTALFAMLNSCVPGIAVMNIDNGFGAGCLAHKINTLGA
jgi:NCAIR mutase (PurE)-related protein